MGGIGFGNDPFLSQLLYGLNGEGIPRPGFGFAAGVQPGFGVGFGVGVGQDPLSQLLACLQGGQMGGGVDQRALRNVLRNLDRAIVEKLLSGGFSPDALSGLVQGNLQNGGMPGFPGGMPGMPGMPGIDQFCGPQLGGPALFNSMPQLGNCFPQQQLFNCFPGCAMNPSTNPCFPQIPTTPFPGPGGQPQYGRTFDVWFENRDGQKSTQRSPIVLDLNGNGRPDLTGNVGVENGRWVAKGAGKVDFDIDPSKRSWSDKSVARRPGKGAPAVPGGYAKVYDDQGKLLNDHMALKDAVGQGSGKGGIKTGRAEIFDQNNNLVGEYKRDSDKNQYMYHWGNRKDAEKTEWMAPGGADGLLSWDVNGDGKIDSSKELFGEFDIDGQKKFANGYQKLQAYFDVNGDGVVAGQELQRAQAAGVRVWRDMNGDGKTDAGELQTLDQNNVRALGTQVNNQDMSSGMITGPQRRWW